MKNELNPFIGLGELKGSFTLAAHCLADLEDRRRFERVVVKSGRLLEVLCRVG